MTDLQPGQHSITVSKPGYVTDTRSINVTSATALRRWFTSRNYWRHSL